MVTDDPAALEHYLRKSDPSGDTQALPIRVRIAKRLLPHAVRTPIRKVGTRAQLPFALRRARRRSASTDPLRLNLGCGFAPLPGWINVDLAGASADFAWDLGLGLPFADNTVEAVVHEHLLEHLPLDAGMALHRESLRVLKPNGVLRVAVPDAGALLGSYAGSGDARWVNSHPTPMLAVNAMFYGWGHRFMYDADLLIRLLRLAGFRGVERRQFGESRITPCPDTNARRAESLYVEAVPSDRTAPPVGLALRRTPDG